MFGSANFCLKTGRFVLVVINSDKEVFISGFGSYQGGIFYSGFPVKQYLKIY